MPVPFADRFAAASGRYGPLVLGADPHGPLLEQWGLTDTPDGLDRFTDIILHSASRTTGLLKPQSAFFERHGWRGIKSLTRLIQDARADGILVILDVKRGDVGSTNDAYAQAYLGDGAPVQADAITVHPYLGLAAMGSYVERAHQAGACLLVVTRSSNPEGRVVQRAVVQEAVGQEAAVQGADVRPGGTGDGRAVEEHLLAEIGAINARLAPGGIGPVGAVIGTAPGQPPLDLVAASALYLCPGVGAQGATSRDVAATFVSCPDRVLPSASRSLLQAGPGVSALRDAVCRLNDEFREVLGKVG